MSTFTAPGDRVLILLPGETPGSVGDLLATALARLGAISIKHGPVRDPAATLGVISRERIEVIVGVPTHVLSLACCPSAPKLQLRSVLLTTDHVPNAIKRTVESAFHCAVYNHYGMTETGLGGGVECEARRGYHLREADLLYEIVDPATGEPLPDGESGEVVFTTLTRRGMPLIRYRTGDVSRFTPGDCPCGTRLKTLERITHRIGGRISLGTDHLTMADLDEAIFSIEEVLNFTVRIVDGETRDRLEVQVKMTIHAGEASIAAIRSAIEAIPVVRRALNAGVLEAAVVPTDVIAPSMAKRSLRDERLRS
jgi:phenylacetate-coenzyme A ligase PaaK-like adenylate-forming protein